MKKYSEEKIQHLIKGSEEKIQEYRTIYTPALKGLSHKKYFFIVNNAQIDKLNDPFLVSKWSLAKE